MRVKDFSDKQKFKKLINAKPALKETLKVSSLKGKEKTITRIKYIGIEKSQ